MTKFPLDADGQPIVRPMCKQEERAWLRLAARRSKEAPALDFDKSFSEQTPEAKVALERLVRKT